MKVALWGSYAYGNYGDELMAVQFALYCRQIGLIPVVYGLSESVCERHSIASTRSADDLIRGAHFCVFGGGSLLSGGKPTVGSYADTKRLEYNELIAAVERYDCPIYFSSIGGDGPFGDGSDVSSERVRLLRCGQARTATVRQPSDVDTIRNRFGIDAEFFPDVLLGSRRFFDLSPATGSEDIVHIGLSLPRSYRWLVPVIYGITACNRNVVIHVFGTVRGNADSEWSAYEMSAKPLNERVHIHPYSDPLVTLSTLGALDVLITTKLHIGVTALSFGVPYVCVGKTLKSKAFLHSVGHADAYWGDLPSHVRNVRLASLILRPSQIRQLRVDQPTVAEQALASVGHLTKLQRVREMEYQRSPR